MAPKEKSGLEKELEAMMLAAGDTLVDAKKTGAEAGKVRRKSRDLEDSLEQIVEASGQWKGLVRRSRRKSKDFGDDCLKEAFEEMDEDKSGFISKEELDKAIRKVEAGVVGADMDSMYEFADKDGDGKISYEEFKKIMLYKQAPPKA